MECETERVIQSAWCGNRTSQIFWPNESNVLLYVLRTSCFRSREVKRNVHLIWSKERTLKVGARDPRFISPFVKQFGKVFLFVYLRRFASFDVDCNRVRIIRKCHLCVRFLLVSGLLIITQNPLKTYLRLCGSVYKKKIELISPELRGKPNTTNRHWVIKEMVV